MNAWDLSCRSAAGGSMGESIPLNNYKQHDMNGNNKMDNGITLNKQTITSHEYHKDLLFNSNHSTQATSTDNNYYYNNEPLPLTKGFKYQQAEQSHSLALANIKNQSSHHHSQLSRLSLPSGCISPLAHVGVGIYPVFAGGGTRIIESTRARETLVASPTSRHSSTQQVILDQMVQSRRLNNNNNKPKKAFGYYSQLINHGTPPQLPLPTDTILSGSSDLSLENQYSSPSGSSLSYSLSSSPASTLSSRSANSSHDESSGGGAAAISSHCNLSTTPIRIKQLPSQLPPLQANTSNNNNKILFYVSEHQQLTPALSSTRQQHDQIKTKTTKSTSQEEEEKQQEQSLRELMFSRALNNNMLASSSSTTLDILLQRKQNSTTPPITSLELQGDDSEVLDKKARKKDQNRRAAHNYRRKKMEEKNRIREEEMLLVYSRVCLIGLVEELEDSIMFILNNKTKKMIVNNNNNNKDQKTECYLCPICLQTCDTTLNLRSHINTLHSH